MGKAIPIIPGQKFNYLTVVFDGGKIGGRKAVVAKCDCGKLIRYRFEDLRSGNTKSCGCNRGMLKRNTLRKKHGAQFKIDGDVAKAKIGGKYVLIDAEDIDLADKYRWSIGGMGYCATQNITNGAFLLHRLVMGLPESNIDHISGNKLDNRKKNLRICTQQENMRNKIQIKGSSKFKGVSWHKKAGKWAARVTINRVGKHIGLFEDEKYAAELYDLAALRYFGRFARLNFPIEGFI